MKQYITVVVICVRAGLYARSVSMQRLAEGDAINAVMMITPEDRRSDGNAK